MKQFKSDLALIYNQALDHYKGDKVQAAACVEAYCRGLLQENFIKGKEKSK